MDISPETQRKIRKILENEGDVTLAQLEAVLELGDKLESVIAAIQGIPQTEIPENEYPSSIEVANLPEVQKVEITNPPEKPDDSEVRNLLRELVAEVKKKEQYEYSIEIDPPLKEQLRGERGVPGAPGVPGKDGSPDTPDQVVEKVIESKKLIPKKKVEGLEDLELITKNNAFRDGVSMTTVKGIETNLQNQINRRVVGIHTSGLTPTLYVQPDAPSAPKEGDVWIDTDAALPDLYTPTLILDKTAGEGIKVDLNAPTFPWHDIIGPVTPKATGVGSPARTQYAGGNVYDWKFILNDVCDFNFHIPHDYVPGSALYIHVHWSHNGTAISGNAQFTFYHQYAKGHDQANFSSEKNVVVTYNTTNIAATPQYRHRIDEAQLSTSGGSASLLDSDTIEPDGLIMGALKLTSLPTITGGSLFVHTVDVHYQSTNVGTKQKSPNFYS
jgi:hypothetical protein